MHIPTWKKWLSYVWEFHVESSFSEYSQELYVLLSKGRYQLVTSNAIYSFEDLYVNFSRAFDKLKIDRARQLNTLVLGVGMGSIPMVMESQGFNNCYFTAIEIDETIIDLLSRYGMDKIKSPIEVYQADAVAFMNITQEQFDLIAIDLFINDVIPDDAQSIDFLENVKERLASNGLVMMNHLSLTQADQEKGKRFFNEFFKVVFPTADFIDVGGNWMLINDSRFIQ